MTNKQIKDEADRTAPVKTDLFPLDDAAGGTWSQSRASMDRKIRVTVTQSATPTFNTDNGDVFVIDSLAQAITNMTTNMSGTPSQGDMILFEITDNGTARAIAWGIGFVATTGTALPTTTVLGKTLIVLFERTGASTWRCLSSTSDV